MTEALYPRLAGAMHAISVLACLLALVSFALFALDQSSSASEGQQAAVAASAPPALGSASTAQPPSPPADSAERPGNVLRSAIDDAAGALESPFASLASGQSNRWMERGIDVLGALVLYGLALGYAARLVRMRG